MVKTLRRLHLYLGCFFTPLLLFFVLTGWYQTVNPDRLKSPADAESLLQKFRVVHTDSIYPSETEFKQPSSARLFQWLVIVMSLAATATVGIGVVLAFQTLRNKWPVWICLGLGILLPVLVLWLGQGRGLRERPAPTGAVLPGNP
jgi:hypothetical protein